MVFMVQTIKLSRKVEKSHLWRTDEPTDWQKVEKVSSILEDQKPQYKGKTTKWPKERAWMAQLGPKFWPPVIALKILRVHFFGTPFIEEKLQIPQQRKTKLPTKKKTNLPKLSKIKPCTAQYCPRLTQYHHVTTRAALGKPSKTT